MPSSIEKIFLQYLSLVSLSEGKKESEQDSEQDMVDGQKTRSASQSEDVEAASRRTMLWPQSV